MAIDAGWDASAGQYVKMYRYGVLVKEWQIKRRKLLGNFTQSLRQDRAIFAEFFAPGQQEYGDPLDWELKEVLQS
jgi:hypothetical protein